MLSSTIAFYINFRINLLSSQHTNGNFIGKLIFLAIKHEEKLSFIGNQGNANQDHKKIYHLNLLKKFRNLIILGFGKNMAQQNLLYTSV